MTTLLALDTATEACSVALLHKGEKTFLNEIASRSHTQRILPMVDQILSQSGISLNQVDALAFGRGPGSFTGVRVGTGITQGLALGADLPVIPISNLTTMAQQAYETQGKSKVISAIDARMNEIYFSQLQAQKIELAGQQFIQWQTILAEQVCRPEKAIEQMLQQATLTELQQKWSKVGTGWQAYEAFKQQQLELNTNIELPSAQYMLSLALPLFLQQEYVNALEIEPIYLRNEVTWKKLPNR